MVCARPLPLVVSKRSSRLISCLAVVAAAIAAYLGWVTLTHGTLAGCGDDSSHIACGHVLRSAWSRVVGIPVSLLGCLTYVTILSTNLWMTSKPNHAYSGWVSVVLLTFASMAGGSAIWFLFLQLFVIGRICPFCMVIHLCGVVIAALLFNAVRVERMQSGRKTDVAALRKLTIPSAADPSQLPNARASTRFWSLLPACLAVVLFICLQILFPAKTYELVEANDGNLAAAVESFQSAANEFDAAENGTSGFSTPSPASRDELPNRPAEVDEPADESSAIKTRVKPARTIAFLNGRLKLNPHEHGLLGSPEADLIIIEMVDYTCADCRKVHHYLKQARKELGDRFAVVVFPTPLETSCNRYIRSTQTEHIGACKYAHLSLGVLSTTPEKFGQFHDWLMDSEALPSIEQAMRYAEELAGSSQLPQEGDPERLEGYLRMFNEARIARLPAMIIGDQVMIGSPGSPDELLAFLNKRLVRSAQATSE